MMWLLVLCSADRSYGVPILVVRDRQRLEQKIDVKLSVSDVHTTDVRQHPDTDLGEMYTNQK